MSISLLILTGAIAFQAPPADQPQPAPSGRPSASQAPSTSPSRATVPKARASTPKAKGSSRSTRSQSTSDQRKKEIADLIARRRGRRAAPLRAEARARDQYLNQMEQARNLQAQQLSAIQLEAMRQMQILGVQRALAEAEAALRSAQAEDARLRREEVRRQREAEEYDRQDRNRPAPPRDSEATELARQQLAVIQQWARQNGNTPPQVPTQPGAVQPSVGGSSGTTGQAQPPQAIRPGAGSSGTIEFRPPQAIHPGAGFPGAMGHVQPPQAVEHPAPPEHNQHSADHHDKKGAH